jgi:hypothetical protein
VRDIEISIVATMRGVTTAEADATVDVNGHRVGQFRVSSLRPSEARLRVAAADVGRVFRTGYNRLSIVSPVPSQVAIHRLRIAPLE